MQIPEKYYACEIDNDCILVQDGCCGCGGGGKNTTINKKYEETYLNKTGLICKNVDCGAVVSNNPSCFSSPVCIQNKCSLP